MKYKYLVLSDHYHLAGRCLDEKSTALQHKEIDSLNKSFDHNKIDFRILKGAEINILKDGKLDAPTSVLKSLDVVNAAVHYSFKLDKKDQTKRIITAIENKYTNIIAHLTCRAFGERDPINIDMPKITSSANQNNVKLEINANVMRLDLNDINTMNARKAGALLTIGTDAHALNQLSFMRYGTAVARRAWCEKKDVLNTYSADAALKMMRR